MKYEIPKLHKLNETVDCLCSSGSGNTGANVAIDACDVGAAAGISNDGRVCQSGGAASYSDTACVSGSGDHGVNFTPRTCSTGSSVNTCSSGVSA